MPLVPLLRWGVCLGLRCESGGRPSQFSGRKGNRHSFLYCGRGASSLRKIIFLAPPVHRGVQRVARACGLGAPQGASFRAPCPLSPLGGVHGGSWQQIAISPIAKSRSRVRLGVFSGKFSSFLGAAQFTMSPASQTGRPAPVDSQFAWGHFWGLAAKSRTTSVLSGALSESIETPGAGLVPVGGGVHSLPFRRTAPAFPHPYLSPHPVSKESIL